MFTAFSHSGCVGYYVVCGFGEQTIVSQTRYTGWFLAGRILLWTMTHLPPVLTYASLPLCIYHIRSSSSCNCSLVRGSCGGQNSQWSVFQLWDRAGGWMGGDVALVGLPSVHSLPPLPLPTFPHLPPHTPFPCLPQWYFSVLHLHSPPFPTLYHWLPPLPGASPLT